MIYLKFTLTMPNNNSWNGKWTGDGMDFNVVRKLKNIGRETADKILEGGSFYYNFGDGWGANVDVKEVDSKGAKKAKKQSQGFRGYEWMVDSIFKHNKIVA